MRSRTEDHTGTASSPAAVKGSVGPPGSVCELKRNPTPGVVKETP